MITVQYTQGRGKPNYGTPEAVIRVARDLLGGTIDLDPASSAGCNERVQARAWYGRDSIVPDALTPEVPWRGCVFLNPPGGAKSFPAFWRRLHAEYTAGNVTAAVFVCFSIDALQTTQRHTRGGVLAFPTFIPDRRIAYLDHETGVKLSGAPKPSAIVWLPDRGIDPRHHLRMLTRAFEQRMIYGVSVRA